jgi:hypothetical protein
MTPSPDTRRHAISWSRVRDVPVTAVIAFLMTRAVLLAHHHTETDVRRYYEYARRAAFGEVPYRDIAVEYPPGAWWVVAGPKASDWPTYRDRFRRTMFVFDLGAFTLFMASIRRRRPAYGLWAGLTYVVATTVLEDLLYDRLDVGLLGLLMVWAYTWIRDMEPDARHGWGVASYFALGLAVAYKLVPAVMLPFILASDVIGGRPLSSTLVRLSSFVIGVAAPFLALSRSAGVDTLHFVDVHLARGIQIESIYAVLLWGLSSVGMPLAVVNLPGTIELVSPAARAMVTLSNLLSVAVVGVLVVQAVRSHRHYDAPRAYLYCWLALAGVVLVAKGLSPQYFVWIVPALVLCGAELFPFRRFMLLCLLLTTVSILTAVIFPLGLHALIGLHRDIWLILTARNALFAAIVGWIAADLARSARSLPVPVWNSKP